MPARTTTTPTTSSSTVPAVKAPSLDLSVRQLFASVGAAVTAAILGSRLGVAGTLIGAALASAITMVASAVYSHSLATAQYKIRHARATEELAASAVTMVIASPQQAWGMVPPSTPNRWPAVAATGIPTLPQASAPALRRMARWKMAGIGTLVACALALLTVTGIEAVRGTPLSGGSSGGLSVLGGGSVGTPDTTVPTTVPATTSTTSSSAATSSSIADVPAPTVTSTVTVPPSDPATTATATSAPTSTSVPTSSTATSSATASTTSPAPASPASPADAPPADPSRQLTVAPPGP